MPQIVVVVMRMRASPGPTAGTGLSSRTMRPAAAKTAAFMTDRRASRGLNTAASDSRIIFDEQTLEERSHGQPFSTAIVRARRQLRCALTHIAGVIRCASPRPSSAAAGFAPGSSLTFGYTHMPNCVTRRMCLMGRRTSFFVAKSRHAGHPICSIPNRRCVARLLHCSSGRWRTLREWMVRVGDNT